MLFDATGQPIAARPVPAAVPSTPDKGAPPTPHEQQELDAAREMAEVRLALRNAAVACAMDIQRGNTLVQVPSTDLLALLKVGVASLDRLIESRLFDANGMREPLPLTDAPNWEGRVGELVASVVATLAASRHAATAVQVAPEGVLAQLPKDAEAALKSAQAQGIRA